MGYNLQESLENTINTMGTPHCPLSLNQRITGVVSIYRHPLGQFYLFTQTFHLKFGLGGVIPFQHAKK